MNNKNEDYKKEMFVKGNYLAMDDICSTCGVQAWGVYMWLLRHRNVNTLESYPSLNALAKECRLGNRTIQRELAKLEDNGFIKRQSGGMEGDNHITNRYYFIKYDIPLNNESYKKIAESAKRKHGHKSKKKDNKIINLPVTEKAY